MSIDAETLAEVKRLSREVAKLVTQVEAELARVEKARKAAAKTDRPYWYRRLDSKLTATLRRRSMDLTNALADLRRR